MTRDQRWDQTRTRSFPCGREGKRTKRKVVDAGGRGRRRAIGVVSSRARTSPATVRECSPAGSCCLILIVMGAVTAPVAGSAIALASVRPCLSRSVTGMCAEVLFARDRRGLSVSVLWTPAALRRSTMRHRVRCRSATEGSSSRCALLDVDVR